LIAETILLVIAFGVYWIVGERIDQRLNSVHRDEVDRIMGIDPETTDDTNRPYWLEFWLKQSTRQLGDPTLDRLISISFVAIAAFFGILGYILFGGNGA
jgi:hypothetical protein